MYRVVSADTGVKITVGVYEKVALYVENKIVFVKIGAKIDPWQIRFVIGSNSAGCPAPPLIITSPKLPCTPLNASPFAEISNTSGHNNCNSAPTEYNPFTLLNVNEFASIFELDKPLSIINPKIVAVSVDPPASSLSSCVLK